MPVSPIIGQTYAEQVAQVYYDAETRLLQRISYNLQQGIDSPAWDQVQLARLQNLRSETVGVLAKANREAAALIQQQVDHAYSTGVASSLADAGKHLALHEAATDAHKAAVAALVRQNVNAITSSQSSILRTVEDGYRDVIAKGTAGVLAGATTRRVAVQEALTAFAGQGITSIETARGSMDLATYTNMAVRTATARAALQGHLDTNAANGLNLVTIIPGPRPCDICDGWAGLILSTDGSGAGSYPQDAVDGSGSVDVEVDADLEDARADGWGHPNCRCNLITYLPGVTELTTDRPPWDAEGYAAQQQQRALERDIRGAKNDLASALTPEAEASAKQSILDGQQAMRDHLDANPDLKRQPVREGNTTNLGHGNGRPAGGEPIGPTVLPEPPTPPSPAAFLEDLPKLDAPQTLAEATEGLTSNPGNALKTTEYTQNCSNVVQAVELRARGYDVIADARVGGSDAEIANEWLLPDGTPAKFNYIKGSGSTGQQLLKYATGPQGLDWPADSRGYITIQWKGGGAHIFNVAKDSNGVLHYYEGQIEIPQAEISKYLAQRKQGSSLGVLRVDHLTPTKAVERRLIPVGSPAEQALLDAIKQQAEANAGRDAELAARNSTAGQLAFQREAVVTLQERIADLQTQLRDLNAQGLDARDPNVQRVIHRIDVNNDLLADARRKIQRLAEQ